jgi:hypothetical protein
VRNRSLSQFQDQRVSTRGGDSQFPFSRLWRCSAKAEPVFAEFGSIRLYEASADELQAFEVLELLGEKAVQPAPQNFRRNLLLLASDLIYCT